MYNIIMDMHLDARLIGAKSNAPTRIKEGMQENDAVLSAAQFERVHGYNKGDVLYSEDGKTAKSLLVHRNATGLNTETDTTLDYGKSTVVAYNESIRSAMQQKLAIQVCAVVSKQGHSTYYDRGMFTVKEERMFSFFLEKVGTEQAASVEVVVVVEEPVVQTTVIRMQGKPWSLADDKLLKAEHDAGTPLKQLATMLGRNVSALERRLEQHVKDKAVRKRLGQKKMVVVVSSRKPMSPLKQLPVVKHAIPDEPAAKKRKLNGSPPYGSIVTHYDGNVFRSRHEARFAYLLNQLSVRYEYEGTTFDMKTGVNQRYTPDFYLPELHVWVELKPAYPHWEELARCAELCTRGFPTVLMYGDGYTVPFGYDTHGGGVSGSGYAHSKGLKGMSWGRDGKRLAGELAFTYAKDAVKIEPCNALSTMQAAGHPVLKAAYDATVGHKFE